MKKNSLVKVLAMVMAVTFAFAGCGAEKKSAEDKSWDKIKEKGEFVLGLDENVPPMGFKDEKGEIVGYDIDLANEVCTRLGIKLKIQPIDWNVKEQELDTGNIDCIWNGLTITEERKQKVLFTKPYLNNRQVLVVKGDSAIKTQAELSGKKLALQASSSAADALTAATDFKSSLAEVVELKDNMTVLMDLETGGVDVALMDETIAKYNIEMKKKDIKILDESLSKEEYGIGFRKTDAQLMNKVQETLEAMAKDGKIAEIATKWFGEDISTIGK